MNRPYGHAHPNERPLVTGGTLNVTVFVLAIVFLVLGAASAPQRCAHRSV